MKKKLFYLYFLITFFVCTVQALPRASFNVERSDQYGLAINPRYANFLSPTSAFGFEFSFGDSEFRLNGTWAKIIECRHEIKLTADYLSQQILFPFLIDPTRIWAAQTSFAGGYSYLFASPWLNRFNLGAYQLHSRDDHLPPLHQQNDQIKAIYRNIRGAEGYGGKMGLTLLPHPSTRLELSAYYDTLMFRNIFQEAPDQNRLGVGVLLYQALHPRLALEVNAENRAVFQRYSTMLTWLIPLPCADRLELSFTGQYVYKDLPDPKEMRLGLMLTYRWGEPAYYGCMQSNAWAAGILDSAIQPLVRMPQTFVVVDEKIVNS